MLRHYDLVNGEIVDISNRGDFFDKATKFNKVVAHTDLGTMQVVTRFQSAVVDGSNAFFRTVITPDLIVPVSMTHPTLFKAIEAHQHIVDYIVKALKEQQTAVQARAINRLLNQQDILINAGDDQTKITISEADLTVGNNRPQGSCDGYRLKP